MNVKLFKSKMALRGDTLTILAKEIGLTKQAISLKMRCKNNFNVNQIRFLIERYNLTAEEIKQIFFN